jgi:hypothetical protein
VLDVVWEMGVLGGGFFGGEPHATTAKSARVERQRTYDIDQTSFGSYVLA